MPSWLLAEHGVVFLFIFFINPVTTQKEEEEGREREGERGRGRERSKNPEGWFSKILKEPQGIPFKSNRKQASWGKADVDSLYFSSLFFPFLCLFLCISLSISSLSPHILSLSPFTFISLSLPPSLILFLPLSPPLLKSCFFMDLGGQVGGGAT